MKKVVSLMMFLFAANMCLAGNVKVMKTKYVGADYDVMSGPYMTVNVKLLASHVAAEECACFVLVNNEQWDGENMTISKLSKLAKTMCIGEAELDAVSASKILEIPMSISLDQQRLTGRDTVFYMKTVVVDFTKKDVIAQSDMISFNIDAQRTSEQMLGSVGSAAGGLMGLFFGGNGSSNGDKACPSCGGSGKCKFCDGTGQRFGSSCSSCGAGEGRCNRCGGSGTIGPDIDDIMKEAVNASKRSRQGNQQGSQQGNQQGSQQDDGFGSLLDGLFGF